MGTWVAGACAALRRRYYLEELPAAYFIIQWGWLIWPVAIPMLLSHRIYNKIFEKLDAENNNIKEEYRMDSAHAYKTSTKRPR